MEECKAAGNELMTARDYVGALKYYAQALTYAPRDAALYSNRSFAFLRLQMPARSLADAEEAIRRQPDWSKGYFRKAEALTQVGLHAEALSCYVRASEIDPADQHLLKQCQSALRRDKEASSKEWTQVGALAVALAAVAAMLLWKSPLGLLYQIGSSVCLAIFGGLLGFGYVLVRRHQRAGAVLPPLQSNEYFCALQMKDDRDGAGPLRSKVLQEQTPVQTGDGYAGIGGFGSPAGGATAPRMRPSPGTPAAAGSGGGGGGGVGASPAGGGGGGDSSGSGGGPRRKGKSVGAGRAAALKAMGKAV